MRWWKWFGLAGLLGAVAVSAVVVVQKRRARPWTEYPPEELRARLEDPALYLTPDAASQAHRLGAELDATRAELEAAFAEWEAATRAMEASG